MVSAIRVMSIKGIFLGLMLLFFGLNVRAAEDGPLLIFGPDGPNFETVIQVIREELKGEIKIEFRKVDRIGSNADPAAEFKRFENHLNEINPRLLVLMDNTAIDLYRNYQREYEDKKEFPPAIMCMALFVQDSIKGIKNGYGINYEMPLVKGLPLFRDILGLPVEKVGVVYREEYKDFIERQREQLKIEDIELVTYYLEGKNLRRELDKGLKQLLRKDEVEALWLLNDNILYEEAADVWKRRLQKFQKPRYASVAKLVQNRFGNFGYTPDHHEIGVQIADFVFELLDGQQPRNRVEEPKSGSKMLDVEVGIKYLKVPKEKLDEIDIRIQGQNR